MRIFFILSLFFHTLFAVDDLDNALGFMREINL